jgi:hypothetical protein
VNDRTKRALADIDDVITDWNGSRDSMRWSPGPPETGERSILSQRPSLVGSDGSGAYTVRAMLHTGRAATFRTGVWASHQASEGTTQ